MKGLLTGPWAEAPSKTDNVIALEIDRWLDAPLSTVFAAFTEADQLRRWWGPKGSTIDEIEFPASVGESYRVALRVADGSRFVHVGRFIDVIPDRRLVYTWRWIEGPLQREEMLVELDFADESNGTRVSLRQSPFVDIASRDAHAGWPDSFDRIARWLANSE